MPQNGSSPQTGKDGLSGWKALLFGNACMLLATIFWGVNLSVTKALIPDWMSSNGVAVTRIMGGCLLFWAASMFMPGKSVDREDWRKIFLGGFFGLFAFIYLSMRSLRYGSAIDISIILTTVPMFVILIGIIFQHMRPTLLEYAGIIVSFAGACIVILAGAQESHAASDYLLGDLLAAISAVCYAFYLVILEGPTKKYPPVTLLRWVFLFGAIPCIFILPGLQDMGIWHTTEWRPWTGIAFILFCPTFIAYFLLQPGIRYIGSELTSLYQYLIPVFAAISAVMMGLESLRMAQIWAMVVVVIGMVLTNYGKKKRKQ